jgi:hypothetical protein
MLFPFFPRQAFFGGGAGMPAILMLTEPQRLRLVKTTSSGRHRRADVGRCRLAMDDATELLSRGDREYRFHPHRRNTRFRPESTIMRQGRQAPDR